MTIAKRFAILACLMGTLLVAWTFSSGQDAKPPIVTYEEVLKDLKKGVNPDRIIKKIQDSPATFTLGKDQIDELVKAGASMKLVAEMQKKGQTVPVGSDVSAFVIVLDCSGSMKDKTEAGTTKWDEAKKAAILLIKSVPENRELALIAYGLDPFRAGGECKDVDVLRPLAPLTEAQKAKLLDLVETLKPVGKTPIALALNTAGKELAKSEDLTKLILITDGVETCNGNPAAEAKLLVQTHKHLQGGVDVVGFGLKPEESKAVEEIAKAGQGKYHEAKTVKDLAETARVIGDKIALAEANPRGIPAGLAAGEPVRWYVWYLNDRWHVRTTTKTKEHQFNGTIRVVGGEITSVNPAKLKNKGTEKDWWKLSEGNKVLTLDLKTKGDMEGFDFEVAARANQVVFTLLVDGKERPDLIYVGKNAAHPVGATLTLPAHPEKK